ncbi:MAG: cupin domain-containing protein [Candidatus Competibacteraceae bacterium]|nr:cupin domain-containing protein [Candidatus Competibacteraceae bacterium]
MNDKHAAAIDPASAEAISAAVEPYPLSAERKQAMRERLLSRIATEAPPGTRTVRSEQLTWHPVSERIEIKILHRDPARNEQTALLRCQAGAVLSSHSHTKQEECLVLEGEIRIGQHIIRQGDLHIAEPGCQHPELVSEQGALLLLRSEIYTHSF